jgi:hypothetical protein
MRHPLALTRCGNQRARPGDAHAGRAEGMLRRGRAQCAAPWDQAHLAPTPHCRGIDTHVYAYLHAAW